MPDEPHISYTLRELLHDVKESQSLGFKGVHSRIDGVIHRLDVQNGRVRSNEVVIANIRGRWIVVTLLTSVASGIVSALVVAVILRGL